MSLSRREFLQRGTLLAAGAAVPFSRLNQDRGHGINDEGISADVAPTRTGIGPVVPPAPEGAPPLHSANLLNMSKDSFAAYVNSGFTVQSGKQTVGMTLLSATDIAPPAPPVNLAGFAVMPPAYYLNPIATNAYELRFRGPANIPQGSYSFRHSALGEFALFIVPAGIGEQTYTAIVNHLQSGITTMPPSRVPVKGGGRDFAPRHGR